MYEGSAHYLTVYEHTSKNELPKRIFITEKPSITTVKLNSNIYLKDVTE